MTTPSTSADEGDLPSGVGPLTAEDPVEIGGHPLIGRLGSGGMGIVYLGRDPEGGLVAVKAASGELTDDELVRRYEAEAACLRRAPAPWTVRLLTDGTTHVPPYLITEHVEGRSLAHVVNEDGPLQGASLRALATRVARALAAIHSSGLVHRDVKPANIMITSSGLRVIDFGIAQHVGDKGGPTGPGMVVGSPGWIPPERLNHQPATPASDVFGWGCVVGFAGTGRNPFGMGDPDELAQRTMHDPPDLDGLEDSLRGPVTQALNKDPAGRPNAAELLAWLRLPSVREAAGHPGFGQTVTPVDPAGVRASTSMPETGHREEFPRDAAARTPAAAPAVLPRRRVPSGKARPQASTDGPVPGGSLVPIARTDTGTGGARDLRSRRWRRTPVFAPIAVAVTAAAALVTFLVTTAADPGGTPTIPPAGERSASPPTRAPTHGSRRPVSGTHPPATHPNAPRTARSEPPPTARPDAPVDGRSNAGDQGKGNGSSSNSGNSNGNAGGNGNGNGSGNGKAKGK